MTWNRRIAAWAALALVVVANAVVLSGAALNRAGAPESTLRLTERELGPPGSLRTSGPEDGGVSLRLHWRTLQHVGGASANAVRAYEGGNAPTWLDAAKMKALGFAPSEPVPGHSSGRRETAREVFVVLELDGPARREALRRVDEALKEASAPNAGAAPVDRRAVLPELEDLSRALADERRSESRLFAVDAGLDKATLRARYPDRATVAIVRARISPRRETDGFDGAGRIDALDVDEVHVPLEWRPVFDGLSTRRTDTSEARPRFDATVAVGQRLEPWLAAAAPRLEPLAGGATAAP